MSENDLPVPTEGLAALEEELSVFLRRARQTSNALAASVHEDLEPNAYVMMAHIGKTAHVRVTDLAQFLHVGKPTVSRQLQTLDRLGFIQRNADPADSRSVVLTLTAAGREVLERVMGERRNMLHELYASWSEADLTELTRLLSKLNRTWSAQK